MVSPSSTTRDRLVIAMIESLRRRGYTGTSVKDVVTAANVTVGSMYHHFPNGKPAVAEAALRESGAAYMELLPMLLDQHDDLPTAVRSAFESAADQIEAAGWINMCPVGTVAGEIAESEPGLRWVIADVFTSWYEHGTTYFTARGMKREHAQAFTLAVLSALEGAFIVSRTLRSTAPILAAGKVMSGYAAELLSEPAVQSR